jgi:hypothetical protein
MRRLLVVPPAIAPTVQCFADEPSTVGPTHIVAPRYPVIAKTAHVQGEVELQGAITVDGSVSDAMAVGGPRLLYRSSEEAVGEWKSTK